MKRMSYDADTARYTFQDRDGHTYIGPPHEQYGYLTRVDPSVFMHDRPHAFAPDNELVRVQPSDSRLTFYDFLPSHLIASPSTAKSTLRDSPRTYLSPSSDSGFFAAISLSRIRRSVTSSRKVPQSKKEGLQAPERLKRLISDYYTSPIHNMNEKDAKR
ncbi:hypothetical protein B0H15DRAFT_871543 [Mycena belliarum]|uniref:Uncharacterized protein n=1 Tax=Mycena belliarum TaxID=1033014 RepID=A0AAD6TRP8_9AGAR|nr:hypothetical protein B0H15DRAFT_871543 [Mycena belliae]